MSMLKEFREFAVKGNVVDLAIGVIIGGAFGKIVTSMVDDIIMPIVGRLTGGVTFADKYIALNGQVYENLAAAKKASAPILMYGNFIQMVFNFLIIALCMFVAVKAINKMKQEEPVVEAVVEPTKEEILLTEIRDLLKKG